MKAERIDGKSVARALKKIDPALGMNHCEPQRLNNINALFG
jgi:hypothetical protein